MMLAEIVGLPIDPALTALHALRRKIPEIPSGKCRSGQAS